MKYLACALLPLSMAASAEFELSGETGIDQRYFLQDALFDTQERTQASVFLAPEFYTDFNDGMDQLVIKPFVRLDQHDAERTHVDIREFMWLRAGDDWELRAGIGKVFWGQTESVHLVDVINQTDFVEAVDGEAKLGQPMVNLSLIRDWGTVSLFALPYFRERTFPGVDGRLRPPLEVNTDDPIYESNDDERNLDWALRWQHSIDAFEVGLSYFDGTSREPNFIPQVREEDVVLQPFYPQMQQVGLDVLAVYGDWLLKFEGIYRDALDSDLFAAIGGFEYTSVGVFDSPFDLGWLVEYQYDDRDENVFFPVPSQNDIMLGSRIVFNNIDSTEILLAYVQDLDESGSRSGFVEASGRINDNWKWRFDAWFFSSDIPSDFVFFVRRDDFVELSFEYYF